MILKGIFSYISGFRKRNLMQKAADRSIDIEAHQIVWDYVRESCQNMDEFIKILHETDETGNNIFHIAAGYNPESKTIFEFMADYLKIHGLHGEIQKLLLEEGYNNQSILQTSLILNDSIEFHLFLWNFVKKYLTSNQILELIHHENGYHDNLLHVAVGYSSRQIVHITWLNMLTYLNTRQMQKNFLLLTGFAGKNLIHNSRDQEVTDWLEEILRPFQINF